VVIIVAILFIQVSSQPAWCTAARAAQTAGGYTLCNQNADAETPSTIGSWYSLHF
jgi:hypothetical protein